MDDNPYRAPLSQDAALGVLSGRQEDVRSVALYQKGILVCILLAAKRRDSTAQGAAPYACS